jgi:hypothetical protein
MAAKPTKGIAEKIETLLGQLNEASLTIVDLKAQPRHQPMHFRHGGFTISMAATNDII